MRFGVGLESCQQPSPDTHGLTDELMNRIYTLVSEIEKDIPRCIAHLTQSRSSMTFGCPHIEQFLLHLQYLWHASTIWSCFSYFWDFRLFCRPGNLQKNDG